ncbi:MAG TPA: FAD-binding oxidoreductase [Candidatus Sulfotelmatobacter sp.]|nr:FAD-binding oxidoreductase [Candidatus Sulfotelmatobacter sp.]
MQATIENLKKTVRGAVLCPGQDGYDTARTLPNAMIDRRPAFIARCSGAADVIACVRFAREHDLLVSVRGGGHSVAGKSVCDGGLMIDLSAMKGIRVDPVARTVRAETGLKLGEFDRETQAFGLATTQGVVPTVGMAGLTLGGGWGNLHGKYGLAVDNVIAADVVTADGHLLTASATENQDLFWGVRGGSGNFGVVTSIEFRLHEVGPVFGGAVFYPAAKAKEVLHFWREFAAASPDELVTQGGSFTLPDGVPVFGVAGCYCGPISEGERVLKPLRTFGRPLADAFAVMSYTQLQGMFEPFFPPGRQVYTKSNFLRNLSDEAIDVLVQYVGQSPSAYTFAPFLEHWHGAATRVPVSATAFPHRQYSWNFLAWSMWLDACDSEKNKQWTRQCWEAVRPFLVAGSYGNYVADEGDVIAREAYGSNYERLVALKNKYDPTNFFRMNHNIKPSEVAQPMVVT